MSRRSVTYVVSRWGEPTQTFVRREARGLRDLGLNVAVLSLKRPRLDGADFAVDRLSLSGVAWGVVRAVITYPRASIAVITTVLRRATLRTLVPQLAAALTGLAWVGRGRVGTDHLHAHFGWVAATATWAAATLARVPFSVVLHAFELHTDRFQDGVAVVALERAARVFVISESDRRYVEQRWGIEPTVLRMGVPTTWLETETPMRDRAGVIAVGSLVPKKGHDVLIRALELTRYPWSVTIVGEGPEESHLRSLADGLGLGNRVRLVGRRSEEETKDLLRGARVCALACLITREGDRDGIPVALMEAMALGTPVVSTRVGGIPELVADAGVIVAPGDVGALAAGLDALHDDELWHQHSKASRTRIREEFLVERSARVLREALAPVGGTDR